MVDNLSALRKSAGCNPAPPAPLPVSGEDPFKPFWNKYNQIQGYISELEDSLNEITQLDDSIQAAANDPSRQTELREEMQAKLKDIGGEAKKIQTLLEALRDEVDGNSKDGGENNAEIRLQKNHFHLLNNSFASVVNRFKEIQDQIKGKFAKQVQRHYAIAGISLSEDDTQKIVSQDPNALNQNVFQLIATNKSEALVANTYNKIAGRHKEILEIENTLTEILDLFVQFSIVVAAQGRQIDNIEANLATAKDYVVKGVEHLEEAKKHQKKNRKCIWFVVIAGVILLIVVIVVAVVVPKKNK